MAIAESLLLSDFRKNVSKIDKGIRESTGDVAYPTGFAAVDFLNGALIYVNDVKNKKQYTYPSIGILDGQGTMFIGRTGCGKSTFMFQSGMNIVKQFPTSAMFYDDVECGMADSNMPTLAEMNPEDLKKKLHYRNEGISIENVFKTIQWIADEKKSNREVFEYNTGLCDMYGDPIIKLEPTVYCIDSWAVLQPEDLQEENEMSGQMSTTGAVKQAATLVKRIISVSKSANIILLTINHIMDDIQIGMMHKKTQAGYLKQGERLPGGKTMLYLANNMFRLDDGKKLKADSELGITGFIVDISCVKSRTNKSGVSVPLVFNSAKGFDRIASMYMFLKGSGYITGAGSSFHFVGYDSVKFSQRGFEAKLNTDPELQRIFAIVANEALRGLLSERVYHKEETTDDTQTSFDINKAILDLALVS